MDARKNLRVQKKLQPFQETLDRSRAALNVYKAVFEASGAPANP
jgi:hypothetical protein